MLRMLFKNVASIKINEVIKLDMYQSTRSKLRVAVASVPGPMVKGHLSFVTETHTDDGLPHTLEHLVFMGSKKYPYKGVLDVIANRCLASGTNAHTDQDHTAYTLATAGASGFLKVLPVYIDHLLCPMLTPSQYLTEVHHIDGEGNDSGVVYSEMQDHESEMERMIDQKRKNLFYPKGSSYAADTGGRLKNLRESCSLEKVREYHREFYHPNNMFITVSGIVDHQQLLGAIGGVEGEYLDHIPKDFKRPFQARLLEIQPKKSKIVCPSDDETVGVVEMSWRGPPATDLYKLKALMVLIDYLTDTAGAPLKMDFVQVEDPFCSSVHISIMEQIDCEIIANFGGVPVNKLDKIQERFFSKTVLDHNKPNAFDMERIGFIIEQQARTFLSKLENNAHSLIKDGIVGHQLYGTEGSGEYQQLEERINELKALNQLKKEGNEFWCKLFAEFFTDQCVCVIGEPSEEEVEKIMEKEEQRINEQKATLGPNGLLAKKEELEAAIDKNTRNKPDDDLLNELIVREIEQFALIPVETFQPEMSHGKYANSLSPNFPFHSFVHKVPSDFFEATILFDTYSLSREDRNFLMLWSELMFQSPAYVDGKLHNYEEVAKLATRDLVSTSISVGVSGVYDRFMSLKLRVDNQNFKMLSKWAEIYLKGIKFNAKRVMICAKKMANKTAESKRDGNTMTHFLNTASTYNKNSNTHLYSYLTQEQFHRHISAQLENATEEDAEKVLKRLEHVRDAVLSSIVNVHFSGEPGKLRESDWTGQNWNFLANQSDKVELKCPPDYEQNWEMMGKCRAIAVGGSESAFLLQKAKFDGTWQEALLPEGNTMEALLLTQYLCHCEGPLWNAIRGTGLAYDASIYLIPDRKSIMLSLYRCSQLVSAYEKTKDTVLEILDEGKLDEAQFEAAKRSMVCELVSGQSTVKMTAISAMLATIRNIGPNFTQELCNRIWTAKMDDVLGKGAPTIRQLFDDTKSIRCIALNPSRIDEVKKSFGSVEICKLEQFQTAPAF